MYILLLFKRDMVKDEAESLAYFRADATSLTHQCMAAVIYALIADARDGTKSFPIIPWRLENEAPHPRSTALPARPTVPRIAHGDDWRDCLQAWWKYFLGLI